MRPFMWSVFAYENVVVRYDLIASITVLREISHPESMPGIHNIQLRLTQKKSLITRMMGGMISSFQM